MTPDAIWTWLQWQAHDDPLGFAVAVAVALALPALAVWGVWLGRRTRR